MTTTSLVDPAFLAGIGWKHDAAGLVDLHVLRKRLELQHDVPALALGGVLLLDERSNSLVIHASKSGVSNT